MALLKTASPVAPVLPSPAVSECKDPLTYPSMVQDNKDTLDYPSMVQEAISSLSKGNADCTNLNILVRQIRAYYSDICSYTYPRPLNSGLLDFQASALSEPSSQSESFFEYGG